jgi:hypothetical protein
MKRIERDLGVRNGLEDSVLVTAAHVDRDRPDRVALFPEFTEERLQRGRVATRRAPHDRARRMVDDAGEIALAAAI